MGGNANHDRYLVSGNLANAVRAGDWVTFSFSTNFAWEVTQLGEVEMNFQSVFDNNGGNVTCTTGVNCSVVPEPMTIALLGTGLLGIGGVSVLRRRRKKGSSQG